MPDWAMELGTSSEAWIGVALSLCVGIGLSAACGFRVFVPMFCLSVGAKLGWLGFDEGFAWIGTWPALIAFGLATMLETIAYYVPWFDNALDAIKAPAAMVAGTIATAAFLADVDPLLRWSCAAIAGAGAAGTTSLGMAGVRAVSTAATGGFGNFLVATFEWMAALFMTLLAVLLPIAAAVVTLFVGFFLVRYAWRYLFARRRLIQEASPVEPG